MSLNIKNPEATRLVRRLADLTGATQTGAVEDAVRRRLADLETEASARSTRADRLLASIRADLTKAQKEALRRAEDDLYDQDGLPR